MPTKRPSSIGQKSIETPLPNSANRADSCNTPFTTPAAPARRTAYSGAGATPVDRKQLNEQAAQVIETLRKHFGSNFLPDGLSSITARQFIATFSYFMKNVIGNQRGIRLNTTKLTIDDINKYLIQVGYTTNKQSMSWMKTPNALHSLSKLVDLLQWLCMFLPPPDAETHPFERTENILFDDCFEDAEYVELFNATLKGSFMLWNNNQKEEFDNSKAQLIDKYIHMRTNIPSKAEIESVIDKEKSQLKKELKNRVVILHENQKLIELLAKEKNIRGIINELMSECEEKTAERDNVHNLLHQQELIVKDLEEKVKQLRNAIAQQPCSRVNINLKIATLAKQRDLLEMHSDSVSELKNVGFKNQMKHEWTLKQLNNVAVRFNTMVNEKFVAIGERNWFGFTLTDMSLNLEDKKDLRGQIDRIFRNFESIHQQNIKETDSIRLKIADMVFQLQSARSNLQFEQLNYENVIKQDEMLKGQLKVIDFEIQKLQAERGKFIDAINGLKDAIGSIKLNENKLDAQILKITADNMLEMDEYDRQGEKLLQIRRERQNLLRKAIDEIHKSLQEFKNESGDD